MAAQASELSEPVIQNCMVLVLSFLSWFSKADATMCWSYGSVFLSYVWIESFVHPPVGQSTPDSHFICPYLHLGRPFHPHSFYTYTLLIVAGCASHNQSSICRCCRWLQDRRVCVCLEAFRLRWTHKRRCYCCLARIGNGCVGIPLAYLRHIPITSHHVSCTLLPKGLYLWSY